MLHPYILIIAPLARDDLRAIQVQGRAQWGDLQAENYLQEIKDVLWMLTRHPRMGILTNWSRIYAASPSSGTLCSTGSMARTSKSCASFTHAKTPAAILTPLMHSDHDVTPNPSHAARMKAAGRNPGKPDTAPWPASCPSRIPLALHPGYSRYSLTPRSPP